MLLTKNYTYLYFWGGGIFTMFNFKKGLILLLIICITLLTVSFVSAESLDDNVVSIGDDSLSGFSAVDDKLSSSNIGSQVDLMSADSDSNFEDNSEVNIEDNTIKANLKATKLNTTYKSGEYFTFKVVESDTNNPVPYAYLKLRVYTDEEYDDYYIDSDENGIAKFKTSSLSVGYHKVVISDVDDFIDASSINSSIKINKAKTVIKAPKVTTTYNKNSYFGVTVKNKAINKVVSGLKLKLKVYTGKKYKTYTVKTNSKGVAKFKTNKLGVGTHKVIISTSNKNYAVNSKSSIVIKKAKKKATKKSTTGAYVGSQNSDVFHYSSCASAKRIKSYNKITFSSRSKAIASGYRPCYKCHP